METRAEVAVGDFCSSTAVISSSETGPEAAEDDDSAFAEAADVLFAGTLVFEASSFAVDLTS